MEFLKIKSKGLIEKIERFLKDGKILVFPTDTIYGLLADAANKESVKKVLKIKRRKKEKPIPVFVSDLNLAKKIAEISTKEEKFLKEVWPGKITVVLKRHKDCNLPEILFGNQKTIGLRIPKYPLLNKVLKKIKLPLTGTSANISGVPGSVKLKDVLNQFKDKEFQPDVVIDAGNLKTSKHSTVIDLTGTEPQILRS